MKMRLALILAAVILAIAFAAWYRDSATPGSVETASAELASERRAEAAATGSAPSAAPAGTATATASRPLRLSSSSELNRLIATHGIDDADTRYAIFVALDLCEDARLIRPGTLTPTRMIEHLRTYGKTAEADHADAMRARLCNEELDIPEELALAFSENSQLAIHEFERDLVEAATLDYHGTEENSEQDRMLLLKLGSVIKTTDSLTSFVEALSLANEKQAFSELIGTEGSSGYPPSANVTSTAAYLAACETFHDCGPASLLAARLCFNVCTQPTDVHELLRQHVSPREFAEAQALAQRIRAFRDSRT